MSYDDGKLDKKQRLEPFGIMERQTDEPITIAEHWWELPAFAKINNERLQCEIYQAVDATVQVAANVIGGFKRFLNYTPTPGEINTSKRLKDLKLDTVQDVLKEFSNHFYGQDNGLDEHFEQLLELELRERADAATQI